MQQNNAVTDRASVLYVEDHPINAMLMAALFERRPGLRLVVAQTGAEALRLATEVEPVLLLLDLRLPDCHGSELLPLLRLLPGCEDVPAVAVTAEDDFRIEGTGFCELWCKPLDLARVLSRIDALAGSGPLPQATGRPDPPLRRSATAFASRA